MALKKIILGPGRLLCQEALLGGRELPPGGSPNGAAGGHTCSVPRCLTELRSCARGVNTPQKPRVTFSQSECRNLVPYVAVSSEHLFEQIFA